MKTGSFAGIEDCRRLVQIDTLRDLELHGMYAGLRVAIVASNVAALEATIKDIAVGTGVGNCSYSFRR